VKHRKDRQGNTIALIHDEIRLDEEKMNWKRCEVTTKVAKAWIFGQRGESMYQLAERPFRYGFAGLLLKIKPDVVEIVRSVRRYDKLLHCVFMRDWRRSSSTWRMR
jgi:hypothetical protein